MEYLELKAHLKKSRQNALNNKNITDIYNEPKKTQKSEEIKKHFSLAEAKALSISEVEKSTDALTEKPVSDRQLTRSIIVSSITILICMTCLFGLTWAWFSDSVVTSSNKITAASFDLDITVTEQKTKNPISEGENGYYVLDAKNTYTVTLAKLGTAKTGFCHLSVITPESATATAYYTDSIPQIDEKTKEETELFVFTVSGVSKIKFTAMWGQYPEDQKDKVVQYKDTLSLATQAELGQKETKSEKSEDNPPAKTTTPSTAEKKQPESSAPSTEAKTSESTTGSETTGTPEPAESSAQTETTNP